MEGQNPLYIRLLPGTEILSVPTGFTNPQINDFCKLILRFAISLFSLEVLYVIYYAIRIALVGASGVDVAFAAINILLQLCFSGLVLWLGIKATRSRNAPCDCCTCCACCGSFLHAYRNMIAVLLGLKCLDVAIVVAIVATADHNAGVAAIVLLYHLIYLGCLNGSMYYVLKLLQLAQNDPLPPPTTELMPMPVVVGVPLPPHASYSQARVDPNPV